MLQSVFDLSSCLVEGRTGNSNATQSAGETYSAVRQRCRPTTHGWSQPWSVSPVCCATLSLDKSCDRCDRNTCVLNLSTELLQWSIHSFRHVDIVDEYWLYGKTRAPHGECSLIWKNPVLSLPWSVAALKYDATGSKRKR